MGIHKEMGERVVRKEEKGERGQGGKEKEGEGEREGDGECLHLDRLGTLARKPVFHVKVSFSPLHKRSP